jgi:hypothetical protein
VLSVLFKLVLLPRKVAAVRIITHTTYSNHLSHITQMTTAATIQYNWGLLISGRHHCNYISNTLRWIGARNKVLYPSVVKKLTLAGKQERCFPSQTTKQHASCMLNMCIDAHPAACSRANCDKAQQRTPYPEYVGRHWSQPTCSPQSATHKTRQLMKC